jgi:hypothetical protein
MSEPPLLDPSVSVTPYQPQYALLINPFYPKDADASFSKHVLTPTLALTSFAATSPPHWRVEYWDENLLHGRPPYEPLPELVGITVHLTFAKRAFELADWYRSRGSKVVLGGLHVLSCPEECRPQLKRLRSATAYRRGRKFSPIARPESCSRLTLPLTKMSIARTRRPVDRFCRAAVS